MKVFFEEPIREFNVREIARLLKISPATASKDLKNLESEGLLRRRKERMLTLYKANMESELYRDTKIFYNIRKIKESGILEEFNQFYLKPIIVFFGSGVSGMDTSTSDFDFVIISENKKEFPKIKEFGKKINRDLQIFVVQNIWDLKNQHLINNVLNGITLQGKIKWT